MSAIENKTETSQNTQDKNWVSILRTFGVSGLTALLFACSSITTDFGPAHSRYPSSWSAEQFPKLEVCDRSLHYEYPLETRELKPGVPHTIKEMDAFLKNKLGVELVHSIKENPETRVIIALGPGSELQKNLKSLGKISEIRPIENPFGAFNVVELVFQDKKRAFLLTNVNGRSRYIQVSSLLRLSGMNSNRISLLGELTSYKSIYKNTFREIGHQPDLVVYGFANTAVESLLTKLDPKNKIEIIEKNMTYSKAKWQMPAFDHHELENLGVQIITTPNGKKVWLIDNEYGDRAVDLYEALEEHGYGQMIYFGTAGSLNPHFNVGDIVTPEFLFADKARIKLGQIGSKIGKSGLLGDVESPSLETIEWLIRQNKLGVDFIEVELGKILTFIHRNQRKNVNLDAYLIISDILESSKHVDYTQWTETHRQEIREKLWPLLRSFFSDELSLTDKEISYEIRKFVTH